MRKIIYSPSAEKQLKKVSQYQGFDPILFNDLITKLASGVKLDLKYKDHQLSKVSPQKYRGLRDFHLKANIVVVYELTKDALYLRYIGSHQDLGLTEKVERNYFICQSY